jgi:hypothetical protein
VALFLVNVYNAREDDDNSNISNSRDNDFNNIISISNHKNTLQSFIEKSPLGVRFGIIVLFYMARTSMASSKNNTSAGRSLGVIDLSSFSFTSKEFFDTYSQLASDMGLTKFLIRHMAFAEYMLTLEYLAIVREDELTANYRFKVNFDDLKWLASLSLQQITGGYGMSSSEIFYSSTPPIKPSPTTAPTGKSDNRPVTANTHRAAEMIKDLSLNIFSQGESELYSGSGTGTSDDNFVTPRSKDYGLYRSNFSHRAPATTYSFRKPNDAEWKRIIEEFFTGLRCVTCNAEVLPQQFDLWIGEPLEDNATPSSKRDQRMSEVLADVEAGASANRDHDDNSGIDNAYGQQYFIDYDRQITDREILTYNYGIIPMDGRDAFIAFAKPKNACPNCGANPADSVSLMPKY